MMQNINNSEEVINPLSSIIRNLNIIDVERLQTEDIVSINRNIDDYNNFFTTQQAEFIDYSNFSEHVFFDSAVNKVIFGFNKLLNFPYDTNEFSYKQYINNLEGYTGYLYRNVFPKNRSFVRFEGNQKVLVKNSKGFFLDDHEDKSVGLFKPRGRFSFNFWLNPKSNNFTNNQIIFKFYNNQKNSGFICFLSFDNNNNQKYYINFLIVNDQEYKLEKTEVVLDEFFNTTINVTNLAGNRNISFLINGNKVDNSVYGNDNESNMSTLDFDNCLEEVSTEFIFGSCENISITLDNKNYVFTNFKGDIDEFRYYHKIKSIKETKREMHKNVFSQEGLVLYLKFNEPGGNYLNSYVCLDSSSNKVHGLLLDENNNIIQDTLNYKISENTPLRLEKDELSPVVNSSFPEVVSIRESLIEKASSFDSENNNLIFNLMPKHYFIEAGDYQNLPTFSSSDKIKAKEINGKLIKFLYQPETNTFESYQPANNHLVNIVLIWARFFDQLKIMLDSISSIIDVDYDTINENKVLGLKIPLICRLYGLNFTEMFTSVTKRKSNKEALNFDDIVNEFSIRKIQNEIWYKILINSQSFLRSKGTINAIENLTSCLGLNISDNITIREYSNFNNLDNLDNQYIESTIKYISTNFLNRKLLSTKSTFDDTSSFSKEKPHIEILNLKHFDNSALETYENYLVSNENIKNGLGENFSIEIFFNIDNFLLKRKNIENLHLEKKNFLSDIKSIQNLLRIDYFKSPFLNVYFTRKNIDSNLFDLTAEIKPVVNSFNYNFKLEINDVDIFDKESYICITQSIENSNITYELYSSKANSSIFAESLKKVSETKQISNFNSLNLLSNKENINLRIGEYYYDDTTNELFSILDTDFQGEILNIKTWSKKLEEDEIQNHVKNINNISESNIKNSTLVNNFFIKKQIEDSNIYTENDNKFIVIDNNSIIKNKSDNSSINECRFSIKSNNDLKKLIKYNELLIKNKNLVIDSNIKQNKVNILSYNENINKIKSNNFNNYPSNSMPYDFNYDNENRLSVDFSISKALNDDISKLLVNVSEFNEVLNCNSMYAFNYANIEKIRNDYFNRIQDNVIMNYSSLANVFRYFDNILSSLLTNMIPSKTKFQGFNLVYESHILERHKYQHRNSDSRVNIYNSKESYNFSREQIKSYRDSNFNNNRSMLDNVID
jgi:hypothetical protein